MTLGAGSDTRRAALAARLQRLRLAAGLGVDELADVAGLPRDRYRDVEAGRADAGRLTYLDLLNLAEALDVLPAAILADHPTPPAPPAPPAPREPREPRPAG